MSTRPLLFSFALGLVLVGVAGCGKPQPGNAVAATTTTTTTATTTPAATPYPGAPLAAPLPPPDPCPSIGTLAEAKGPIALNGARMVRLNTVCTANDMTAHLRTFGEGTRFILVADDLRAGVQPGALFELRLGPPTTGEAAVIGTINFYAAQRPTGMGQPHSISFDVTGQVQSLAVSGWPTQGLGVAVAPSGPVAPGADATVGAIRLVAQAPR